MSIGTERMTAIEQAAKAAYEKLAELTTKKAKANGYHPFFLRWSQVGYQEQGAWTEAARAAINVYVASDGPFVDEEVNYDKQQFAVYIKPELPEFIKLSRLQIGYVVELAKQWNDNPTPVELYNNHCRVCSTCADYLLYVVEA